MTGQSIERLEDDRFLRGAGRFAGNLCLPGMLHAAILRSPHAAARIKGVETSAARRVPGVVAVYAFADLAGKLKAIPQISPHPSLRSRTPFPLVRDVVRHEGEAVAVVAAESPTACEEALEAITVAYDPLETVLDAEQALTADCRKVHEDLPDNIAASFQQEVGNVDEALAKAACVVSERLIIGRISAQPMETRVILARFEAQLSRPRLTAWFNTQAPHISRSLLAQQVGLAPDDIRVISPDAGGGFGVKNRFYPENTLIPMLAMATGRPVRWVETRQESFTSTYHERQQVHDITLGLNADGTILAVRDRFVYDQGAYTTLGVVVPYITSVSIPGPYRVPNFHVDCRCAYTNKTPSAPYRGAGKPQASFVMERILEKGAHHLGLDPLAVRRRNLIGPESFPYDTGLLDLDGTRVTYDSGSYLESLDRTLGLIGHAGFPEEKRRAADSGKTVGIGVSCFIEMTGRGPYESALVRVEGGRVQVYCGIASQGQGHQTALAQVCAERLEIGIDQVQVNLGDTASIPLGIGVYAARCAVMAGNAVALAADAVRQKALEAGAALLGLNAGDVEYAGGKISEKAGAKRSLTIAEIAGRLCSAAPRFPFPPEFEPGLEALRYYKSSRPAYSHGTYAVVVEVDSATGVVRILRHALTHDCGVVLNPRIVEGQIMGGVTQGIGAALFEEIHYTNDGKVRNRSLRTYLLPRATEIPKLMQASTVTPSPFNPLGVKGVGEAGTIPVAGALASAIENALGNGARITSVPMRPPQILQLAQIPVSREK